MILIIYINELWPTVDNTAHQGFMQDQIFANHNFG